MSSPRRLAALAGAFGCVATLACVQSVMRSPGDPATGPREAARAWKIGGIYFGSNVLEPDVRPLRARLRVGEERPLWLLPEGAHFGGEPRVRWVSTHPEVASVARAGGQLGASLRGLTPGETEVYAIVRVHGGVRADLAYYCCSDWCDPALPRCEALPIERVVVTAR